MDYEVYRKIAYSYAIKKGMPAEDADDFAQDAVVANLCGRLSTLRQLWIDALRKKYGDYRCATRVSELQQNVEDIEAIAVSEETTTMSLELQDLADKLEASDAFIMDMLMLDLDKNMIAQIIDLTPGAVSVRYEKAIERVKFYVLEAGHS